MKRTSRVISTVAALLLAVSVAAPAQAGLLAKSAKLNLGGFPVWLQDQTGLALQGCLDGTLGPLGTDPPKCFLPNQVPPIEQVGFDPVAPKSAANWPAENMYYLATAADITLPTGQIASVEFAVEATVDTAGAAIAVPGNQLMFHRLRMLFLPNTAAPAGTYTVIHPWGTTVFTPADQENPFGSGGARGRATADVNLALAADLPTPFAGILGNVPLFTMSTFPASVPVPPAINPPGFLGDCATFLPITGGLNGNTVQILGPDGVLIGQTNLFTVCAQKIGMDVQPRGKINCGEVNINVPTAVPAPKTINITNTTLDTFTFGALTATPVTAGDPAADFTITTPSVAVPGGNACTTLAGGATCSFDINFTPSTASLKGIRTATITLAPTATLAGGAADPPPPVTLNLIGAVVVTLTTATDPATPHGTITLDPIGGVTFAGTAPVGTPVTFTATPANKKFKVKAVVAGGTPLVGPTFPLTTGTTALAVTATFMPSGDLNGDGAMDAADALKALRIVAGVQAPVADDKAAMIVAPLVGGTPTPVAGRVEPNIGDVLVILKRALGLVTF